MHLYPLKFKPRLVEKMWGGRKLGTLLNKPLPPGVPIGESWELYDFPPGVVSGSADWVSAEIANGPLAGRTLHALMEEDAAAVLGDVAPVQTPHGPQFPLLVKFLDAEQDLSVQVHPDETYAAANPGAHLKNEAWTILHHEPNARLLKGLEKGVTPETLRAALADGTVERHLTAWPAAVGETYYLPSGTVHALGAGMVVAEVQTPSDTTYRVFDFERVDPSSGKKRELHVEQAMACIDFERGPGDEWSPADRVGEIVRAPQFTVRRQRLAAGEQHNDGRVPRVLLILSGSGRVQVDPNGESFEYQAGDTWLIPAGEAMRSTYLHATEPTEWLDVRFPASA